VNESKENCQGGEKKDGKVKKTAEKALTVHITSMTKLRLKVAADDGVVRSLLAPFGLLFVRSLREDGREKSNAVKLETCRRGVSTEAQEKGEI
jgi:hypothetical protein